MKIFIDKYDDYKDKILTPPPEPDPNDPNWMPPLQQYPYEDLTIRDLVFAGLKIPQNSVDQLYITFDAVLEDNRVIRFGICCLLSIEEKEQIKMDDVAELYEDALVRGIGDLSCIDQYVAISGFRKNPDNDDQFMLYCKKKSINEAIYTIRMDKANFVMVMNVINTVLDFHQIASCTDIMDSLRFLKNSNIKVFKIADFGISAQIKGIYMPEYKSSFFKKNQQENYRIYTDILFKKNREEKEEQDEARIILDMIIDNEVYKKMKGRVKTMDDLQRSMKLQFDTYTVTSSVRIDYSVKSNTPLSKTIIICQNNDESKTCILDISNEIYSKFIGDLYNNIISLL